MYGLVMVHACTGSRFPEELNANLLLPGCHRACRSVQSGLLRWGYIGFALQIFSKSRL